MINITWQDNNTKLVQNLYNVLQRLFCDTKRYQLSKALSYYMDIQFSGLWLEIICGVKVYRIPDL